MSVKRRHMGLWATPRPLRFIVTLAALVALGSATPGLAAAVDWPQFRFDASHSGTNATETAIGPGNVSTLITAWTGLTGSSINSSSAAEANGVVYIGSDDGRLYAFDASGTTGCSGVPKTCSPLWTAGGAFVESSPAVVGGVVYVGSLSGNLYAFDASGTIGCSGTPKTCSPLWIGSTGGVGVESAPSVVDGIVYIGAGDGNLYAFDATGTTGCSGTPKMCAPLWTGVTGHSRIFSSPAVMDGVAYASSTDGYLYAFDASGSVGCSGTPKTCSPLWRGATGAFSLLSSPAVANGLVYVGSEEPPSRLFAFDATGTTSCSGIPKTCVPVWTGVTATNNSIIISSPAVANGTVYVGSADGSLYAFDASGTTGCSGIPKTCSPLWSGTTGAFVYSSPAVANGVVYVGSGDGRLYAFHASGIIGCSGTPKMCSPLWTGATGALINLSSPAIANGVIYVGSTDQSLYAFSLPVGRIISVRVDIKPGSRFNPINLSSSGVIPVAILSTGSFDASSVDASSVCFGDDNHPAQRDCTEAHGTGHLIDIDGDGDLDLVLHFETRQTGIDPGDTKACLTGSTVGGTSIAGCDKVSVISTAAS